MVTKNDKPFGIVTQSDSARMVGLLIQHNHLDTNLEGIASGPLLTMMLVISVDEAVRFLLVNQIRKIPKVSSENKVVGIATLTDLAIFLSPSRRPGLALLILQAISRGKKK